jgi:adenylyl-sulfate kinase
MDLVKKGFVLWFTGLSGAGKSTMAARVGELLGAAGVPVELLDGDEVRTHLSRGLGYSREDRDTNVRRIGFVARLLARHGIVVITAAISPYADVRAEQRTLTTAEGSGFVEVYMECPLEVLRQRDVKGLYRRALAGEIDQFTGVSDPYEAPVAPEVVVRSDREGIEEGARRILQALVARQLLADQVLSR